VSEGKKGRVICAWCKGDMGEAETDLDTHGCCLGCLKLALREVDERLSAFGQGQEAGQRARKEDMARVLEMAEFWREALMECGTGLPNLGASVDAVTEPGFQEMEDLKIEALRGDWRWYVPDLLSEHWEELSMETRLGILVMAQTCIDGLPLT